MVNRIIFIITLGNSAFNMRMLKVITLQIEIILACSTVYAQNTEKSMNNIIDTSMFFYPSKYLLDTINMFGHKKDNEFYKIREKDATLKNSWYSEQLIKLNEPKLYNEYYYESYRFTWFGYLKTSHNPISIRIENQNGNIFLITKYICSKGCSKNKGLIVNDTVNIEKKEWENFKARIDSMNFWNIPPIEKTEIVIMDGSTWIFEGKNDKLYNMVHRSCGKKKEIGEICLYLLKLSNLKIKNKDIY
ncbi:MAG: hypothetical protein HPY79_02965 [Bacteroidales bacterium]|nr:hypothetical protein [Bacteroidales bacterium]